MVAHRTPLCAGELGELSELSFSDGDLESGHVDPPVRAARCYAWWSRTMRVFVPCFSIAGRR